MVSLTPFGRTGPYSEWKRHDLNAFHMTGAVTVIAGRPVSRRWSRVPFRPTSSARTQAAAWGLAAVHGRRRRGGGQHLDVSCAEAIAALFVAARTSAPYAQDGVFGGTARGSGMPLGAPATICPAKMATFG